MTDKEKLASIIKHEGKCGVETSFICNSFYDENFKGCPINLKSSMRSMMCSTHPQERYEMAVELYTELYGVEDLVEVLL
jgi:hypothetical protein